MHFIISGATAVTVTVVVSVPKMTGLLRTQDIGLLREHPDSVTFPTIPEPVTIIPLSSSAVGTEPRVETVEVKLEMERVVELVPEGVLATMTTWGLMSQ